MVLTSGVLFAKRDATDIDAFFKLRLRLQPFASRAAFFPSLGLPAQCRAAGCTGRLGEAACGPSCYCPAPRGVSARAGRFDGTRTWLDDRGAQGSMALACRPTPPSRSGLRLRQDRRSILSYCPERVAPMACRARRRASGIAGTTRRFAGARRLREVRRRDDSQRIAVDKRGDEGCTAEHQRSTNARRAARRIQREESSAARCGAPPRWVPFF